MGPLGVDATGLRVGRFDVLLACGLGVLATGFNAYRGAWWPGALDLAACVAAGMTVVWPRAAGIALGALLGIQFFTPPEWPSMGEYAVLIPILGTGMRDQRSDRLWMTIMYGVMLAALTYQDGPNDPFVLLAIGAWAAIIAALWLIGNTFTAYQKGQDRLRVAALQQQRMALARDLHDTVARDLGRASREAQKVLDRDPSLTELGDVVHRIHSASSQLRCMLTLLRDVPSAPGTAVEVRRPGDVVSQAVRSLEANGFQVAVTIEGDLSAVPDTHAPTFEAVIGELCANIERHAHIAEPCVVIMCIGAAVDAVFINTVRGSRYPPDNKQPGMGLLGLKERLTSVGGTLSVGQEGSRWVSRVTFPT